MTAADLLAALRGRGLRVEVTGGRLRVGPADLLTDADRGAIRRHKPALLAAARGDGGDGGHPAPAPPSAAGRAPAPDRACYALLPNGLAVPCRAGSGLPGAATHWCYPGADRWTPLPSAPPSGLARGG